MFTTGLQGFHDKISLEISKEQLVEGDFKKGWLFILSSFFSSEIITSYGGFWLVENAKLRVW